ncbi:MAG: hypothetical protein LBC12_00740 [Nitrososphaerota archaeon]|jgi:hypothetical protein|nr:hypothetical protein [Nitrososphaerota archaeon]
MKVKLLIPTLIAVLLAILIMPAASASKSSMIWGSDYDQPNAEISVANNVCTYIMTQMTTYMSYTWNYKSYGGTTTKSNVESLTSSCNNNYDASIVFYTGHGFEQYINGANRYHVYSTTSGAWNDDIQDSSIFTKTTAGTHYFEVIWACFQGNTRGYTNPSGNAAGMPYAWTQRNNLNSNGYYNNDGTAYCWIGFENVSPPLSDNTRYNSYTYGDFVKCFYYGLTALHKTVHDALDYASQLTFGVSAYDSTALHIGFWWHSGPTYGRQPGWMKVYGNSYRTLP